MSGYDTLDNSDWVSALTEDGKEWLSFLEKARL